MESSRLPSPVIQLARALAHSPKDGVDQFWRLQAGLPEPLRKPPSEFQGMVDAILELRGHETVADLVTEALVRWSTESVELRKRGFAAVLGAVSEELASKALRGDLDESERLARTQIREKLYRESA
jgi:hypothetical protein